MEIFLIRLLQFVLAISLLVLLHEGGHFFFSKLFGVRVEKFYLFFDPWFHLFEWKPKNSDTAYGIGWLPLGGYCKIAGMIDESLDTEQMKQPVQPWEFRAKPAWQRLFIMIGGVLVNFLLALFIYSMVLFTWGEQYIASGDMTYGMKFNQDAKELGFQDGDILLATDRGPLKTFGADMYRDLSKARMVRIKRNGVEQDIQLSGQLNYLEMLKSDPQFVRPFLPAEVGMVMEGSKAERVGLKTGDRLLAVNGKKVGSYNDFLYEMGVLADRFSAAETAADKMAVRKVSLQYYRPSTRQCFTATTRLGEDMKYGFASLALNDIYKVTTVNYSFFASFPAGISYGWNVLKGYVGDLKYVFTSEGAKSLGGFGAIGSLFPPTWDWYAFWMMTAFLSIILAFMNILPIPALDGGHVLFLLYEMIFCRQPSEKFLVWAEYIGFGALIVLMLVANLNDVLRWLGYM